MREKWATSKDGANGLDIEHQAVKYKNRRSRWVNLAICIVLGTAVFSALYCLYDTGPAHKETISLEEQRQGKYRPKSRQISWIEDGFGGEYLDRRDDGGYVLCSFSKDTCNDITNGTFEIDGYVLAVDDLTLSKDRSKALLSTNRAKHWRHSFYARYWILDIPSGKVYPLYPEHENAMLSLAVWSPNGNEIAFVFQNNIYIRNTNNNLALQITSDGGDNIFNGIPDWVYEEEVFAGPKALWWSPTGDHLAYLKSNDTEVRDYPIPFYINNAFNPDAYPSLREIKYPKPGYTNPLVDIYIYDTAKQETSEISMNHDEDIIITEVVWVGDEELILKVMSRDSDWLKVLCVDASTGAYEIPRSYEALKDGGWFEVTHNTRRVPADANNGRPYDGYVDTLIVDGYNHLGYFSPPNTTEPVLLTSGPWEVVDTDYAVRPDKNVVYFTSTKRSPIEQQLYRCSLQGQGVSPIEPVIPDSEGVYSASYSGDGSYMLVSYLGPDVPSQRIFGPNDTWESATVVEDNKLLRELLSNKSLGEVLYSLYEVAEGVKVNVREIRPSGFDERAKYPVLFFNYGGPNSQMVTKTFTLDYQRIYSETHNAVVITVDPRGTAYMGRDFRSIVRDHLGYYEAHDVIQVAKGWNSKSYVDADTTAIWGWSYGGFLTLKTLETDAGNTFKYGVAVAPVTDWRLYDSIYTERYMHTPAKNSEGYEKSAVSNATALGENKRFLVMHGTGDDNVHFQNTLLLLDKLDVAGVESYDVHVFPDSDHSIYFHNANPMVYDRLDEWLRSYQG